MDFFRIIEQHTKKDGYILKPGFLVQESEDLMVRGKTFYAVWDEERGLWSTNEYRLAQLVDKEIYAAKAEYEQKTGQMVSISSMRDFSSNSWSDWKRFLNTAPDHYIPLDQTIRFTNDKVEKKDYASMVLPYALSDSPIPNYELLSTTLYDPQELEKLEWAIGAIIAGDSKWIQKFLVLYGSAGSGKSTYLDIIDHLFCGYSRKFDAKSLGQSSNQFSMETLRSNPLVAIQHDGDLSRIEDNTRLNSIISHETMIINEKHKSAYEIKLNSFLFMGTNQPVKITDSKSGIIRRLIDVEPSGRRLSPKEYRKCVDGINFELGGIAKHCLNVYEALGPYYYDGYTPISMMYQTDTFFNFVEEYYYEFEKAEYVTLNRAWTLYKEYCESAAVQYRLTMIKVKEELKSYFDEYYETKRIDGEQKRKVYVGFKTGLFINDHRGERKDQQEEGSSRVDVIEVVQVDRLELNSTESEVDILLADCPAQYAGESETPLAEWDKVTTTLKEIDTTKLHYVRPPENHIVIDFDLKDENGNKDAALNLEAAATWPLTYAEFSKGGAGVHLHYIYDGDVSKLSSLYSPGIEVKVFRGKASLRRRLSYCNDIPVAHLSSGLPLKEEKKKMVNFNRVMSEKGLRMLIERNLRKEIVPATKPSIDFIYNDLEAAYKSGLIYDVRDMRPRIMAFANNSSHQRDYCIRLVAKMKFMSEEPKEENIEEPVSESSDDSDLVFFDIECFPNLFLICWKKRGEGNKVVRMYNPKPEEVETLFKLKLVGFNNRKYDNHMIYGAFLGYSNEQLFILSQRLIANSPNSTFREAYNLSYADIYEFSSKKQSLKKFEIDLGIHHKENAFPWDQPLDPKYWEEVGDYCENDVLATEATFEDRYSDFVAYQMVAEIVGMPVNSNGNSMAARLIFGNNRKPPLVYTDLATGKTSDPAYQRTDIITAFPGYEFKRDPETGKMANFYRGTNVGFGGYVYAEPGMYTNVALIDVASMHPNSIIAMNYFGEYTKRFSELVNTRVHIKHKEYDVASKLFDGKFAKFLADPSKIKGLAYALKIFINKVYGMTSAKFDNEFKDPRNVNNIVALRGALFMRTLQDEVVSRGFKVAHIKTDSIKIPNATPEIIQFCLDFAKKYGYTFEHEGTYERMCLVNDAVYIAKYASKESCQSMYGYIPGDNAEHPGEWTATGTQFQVPFVFKTLFSHKPIEFKDLCETKQVTTAIYLDYNEDRPDVSLYEDERKERNKEEGKRKINNLLSDISDEELERKIAEGHDYRFVGKIGLFTPIVSGSGGAELVARRNNKYDAVVGTKDYRWLESETVKNAGMEDKVDYGYYRHLVDDAKEAISQYGDFEWFANNDDPPSEANHPLDDNDVPWLMPCKDPNKTVCEECSERDTCPYISADGVIPWLCEDRDPLGNNCADCPNQDSCHDQMQAILDKEASEQFARR